MDERLQYLPTMVEWLTGRCLRQEVSAIVVVVACLEEYCQVKYVA